MRTNCIASTVFFVIIASAAHAGIEVRNGGDVIDCREGSASPLAGRFVLDYVVTFNYDNSNSDIVVSTDPSRKIANHLAEELPQMGDKLHYFLNEAQEQLFKRPKPDALLQFIARPLDDVIIDDEDVLGPLSLPKNCLTSDGTRLQLVQAFARDARFVSTYYYYDREVLETIKDDPIQLSFMLVHDWLWDYAVNARIIREANRFLHSQEFFEMDGSEIRGRLLKLGLNVDQDTVVVPHPVVIVPDGDHFSVSVDNIELFYSFWIRHEIHVVNLTNKWIMVYWKNGMLLNGAGPDNSSAPAKLSVDILALPYYMSFCWMGECDDMQSDLVKHMTLTWQRP